MMQACWKMFGLSLGLVLLIVAPVWALGECPDIAVAGLKAPRNEGVCASVGPARTGPDGKLIRGLLQCKDSAGKILEESRFEKGVRKSLWFYDAEGRKLHFTFNAQEKAHGMAKVYSPDQALLCELKFKDGRVEGPVKEFYPHGKVHRRYTIKNEQIDGRFLEYTENGEPMLEKKYAHGLDTMEKFFYPDGKLQEHSVRKADGKSFVTKNYWPNGKLRSVASFEVKKKSFCTVTEAVRVGKAYKYAADGSLREEAAYDEDGRPDGLQISIDEQGRRTESVYAKGKLMSKKIFTADGKPESSEEYRPAAAGK